jgi:hypothetical protein
MPLLGGAQSTSAVLDVSTWLARYKKSRRGAMALSVARRLAKVFMILVLLVASTNVY